MTVDGSPHCIQLHYAIEEASKISVSMPKVKHLVSSGGRMMEVSERAVKASRYLSKVEKLLASCQ